METESFESRLSTLQQKQTQLLRRPNVRLEPGNGIYHRWQHPVITRDHVPLDWRYDLGPATNPRLMERIGVNATFNSGAIYWNGRYLLVVRVEGNDRKSYFAVAESTSGVDEFEFWPRPITIPELDESDTNVYDIRLTAHEDGNIYGLFCVERRDLSKPHDTSAAIANCGIVRTDDLVSWERLPNLISESSQQRNVVLHPEFVDNQYALYTRPQSGFIDVGNSGGICWSLTKSMLNAQIDVETPIDPKTYHTVNELKNGQGPTPLRTERGWLHLAHGVRGTAAGMRYVLYMFVTDLDEPWKITHRPGGHFISPLGRERLGDVSNVVFCNGWIRNEADQVFIYYASSDTRIHVATTTVGQLLDYCTNTPEDGYKSAASVETINRLIDANLALDKDMG